jgi:HAMP domain-containing protein
MHADIRQAAYFTVAEDPTWDATAEAADRIDELEGALRQHLAEDVIAKADRIDELEGALEWMVHESVKMRSRSTLDHDSAVDAERWALDLLGDNDE